MPRMASFAKLMAATETALGWEPGDFRRAYDLNRLANTEAVFESDFVAVAVHRFMNAGPVYGGVWEGTATSLLAELNVIVPDDIRHSRSWPTKVNGLGNALDRATPLLRHKGIEVTKRKSGPTRLIILTMPQPRGDAAPAPPATSETTP
jgi:putative DNA primase/helicase